PGPLIPALQSYWIPIHVSATILAGGAFMVSGAAGITYLISHRTESKRASGEKVAGVAGNLPSPELLDRISHRMILFAFPIWTFGVIPGAIWEDEAWGRFWGWDPKEVWSFVSWVIYAAYLHARATPGWRGLRATWINVVGFATIVFNSFAVHYLFSGLLVYARTSDQCVVLMVVGRHPVVIGGCHPGAGPVDSRATRPVSRDTVPRVPPSVTD